MSTSWALRDRYSLLSMAFFLLIGALTGFVNGLLGAGGGIVLIYLLRFAQKRFSHVTGRVNYPTDSKDIFANALAVTLPLSLFSATQYAAAGRLSLGAFSPLILPSLLGGVVGGWLLDRLKLPFVRTLFSLLVLISGIFMILRS